eukprot:UN10551
MLIGIIHHDVKLENLTAVYSKDIKHHHEQLTTTTTTIIYKFTTYFAVSDR